ncbi:hypothetical protein Tco_0749982 [Tanacetum coccineum]|uniref:Uncharacterized protein n=1 Tax=Tanacetum coccineum TaxID=301880 RepID=A0ABQ4Z1C4_9ASTR
MAGKGCALQHKTKFIYQIQRQRDRQISSISDLNTESQFLKKTSVFQLASTLQADKEHADEEIDEQKLEAQYSFMAKIQEVLPEESSSTEQPIGKQWHIVLNKTLHAFIKETGIESLELPLLEHLNRMALSKDETALHVEAARTMISSLSFYYHFGLKHTRHAEDNNNDQASNASFQEDEFINPFCTRVQETEHVSWETQPCLVSNKTIACQQIPEMWYVRSRLMDDYKAKGLWKNKNDDRSTVNSQQSMNLYLKVMLRKKITLINLPSEESFVWIKASSKSLVMINFQLPEIQSFTKGRDHCSRVNTRLSRRSSVEDLMGRARGGFNPKQKPRSRADIPTSNTSPVSVTIFSTRCAEVEMMQSNPYRRTTQSIIRCIINDQSRMSHCLLRRVMEVEYI